MKGRKNIINDKEHLMHYKSPNKYLKITHRGLEIVRIGTKNHFNMNKTVAFL